METINEIITVAIKAWPIIGFAGMVVFWAKSGYKLFTNQD
jgi:hypothetical protein